MRKNVLIYPGNSYAAEEVYFCLKDSLRYRPVLGNHGSAHCEFITDDFYADFPLITEDSFFDYINEFIKNHDIKFIIPTHDTVADFFAKNDKSINACVVSSDEYTADVCRHKRKTYELFKDCTFIPKVFATIDDLSYPVFAKDNVGQGGKLSGTAKNKEELYEILNRNIDIDYVLTEYLPGIEVTVDCFTDRHGRLLYYQPRLRETILTGMSGRSRLYEREEEINEMAVVINERLNLRGYWYFQCKKDIDGHFKLMEISTRFAGTFCITKNLDVNFPLLALTDFDGLDVKIFPNKYEIVSDRGYKNLFKVNYPYSKVYIDFDDTIAYQRKKYIIPTMAFLFQCMNEEKRIILLTRHAYNIRETLADLCIDSRMFENIIEVENGKHKSDYIKEKEGAIFIDNSFIERMNVKERVGIPTFDVCNLECLLKLGG